MMSEHSTNDVAYRVVVNQRGQYSIWLVERALPNGWHEVAIPDDWSQHFSEQNIGSTMTSKQQCLAYIETIWTDMTPLGQQTDANLVM
jgi:MbtH protein